jgi:hypothetical protein
MRDKKELPQQTPNTPPILLVIFTLALYLLIQSLYLKECVIKS